MPNKSSKSIKRKTSRAKSQKKKGWLARLCTFIPGWAWWLGGIIIAVFYVWAFWYFFVSPYGIRWKAIYGEIDYPQGYDIHGIDVSHYQGKIDWELLRNRGTIDECPLRFVMMKATEGANKLDPTFKRNFQMTAEYGFIRGVYHFYSSRSSASEQARFFINNVDLQPGDLPPVLDVENKPESMSKEEFRKDILEWLCIIENHYGVKPIIYTYFKFKTQYLNDEVFDQYPYWIAHYYVDHVSYKGPWKFWQHTDMGVLPGIKGKVDLNIYNGSFYDLQQMTIGGYGQLDDLTDKY